MTSTEENVQVCPDNHRCENGSLCVEHPKAEGKWFCDCDSNVKGVYAGLYCQHEATVYCTLSKQLSRTSFCTNNGVCRGGVDDHSEHLGCDCPSGYTGKHCQFVEGSVPEDFPFDASTSSALAATGDANKTGGGDGTGLGTPGLVVIVLLALAILGAGFTFIIRRRNQTSSTHTIETTKSTDGNLHDPDGENLAAPTAPTDTFDTEIGGDQDDIEEIKPVDSGHLA